MIGDEPPPFKPERVTERARPFVLLWCSGGLVTLWVLLGGGAIVTNYSGGLFVIAAVGTLLVALVAGQWLWERRR